MNARNTATGSALAALLAVSGSAQAADSHRCAAILEDSQRLACYDSTFGKPVRPSVAAPSAAPVAVAAPIAAPVAATPPAPQPPARVKDEPFSGRIVAVGRLSNERFAITLDNGQVWTQLERDLGAEVRAGDTVQLRPAMLGSWMLETRGGVKTRVKLAR